MNFPLESVLAQRTPLPEHVHPTSLCQVYHKRPFIHVAATCISIYVWWDCVVQRGLSNYYSGRTSFTLEQPMPLFKWGAFISDWIDTNEAGDIVSGPFAYRYSRELPALSCLIWSSSHPMTQKVISLQLRPRLGIQTTIYNNLCNILIIAGTVAVTTHTLYVLMFYFLSNISKQVMLLILVLMCCSWCTWCRSQLRRVCPRGVVS